MKIFRLLVVTGIVSIGFDVGANQLVTLVCERLAVIDGKASGEIYARLFEDEAVVEKIFLDDVKGLILGNFDIMSELDPDELARIGEATTFEGINLNSQAIKSVAFHIQRKDWGLIAAAMRRDGLLAKYETDSRFDFLVPDELPKRIPSPTVRSQEMNDLRTSLSRKVDEAVTAAPKQIGLQRKVQNKFNEWIAMAETIRIENPRQLETFLEIFQPLLELHGLDLYRVLTLKLDDRLMELMKGDEISRKEDSLALEQDIPLILIRIAASKESGATPTMRTDFFGNFSVLMGRMPSNVRARVLGAADLLSSSDWLQVDPEAFHHTDSIDMRDSKFREADDHRKILIDYEIFQEALPDIAEILVTRDRQNAHRQDLRFLKIAANDQRLKKSLTIGTEDLTIAHALDDLSAFERGTRALVQIYSKHGLDGRTVLDLFTDIEQAKRSIRTIQINRSQLSEEARIWFDELQELWSENEAMILSVVKVGLEKMMQSPDSRDRIVAFKNVGIVPTLRPELYDEYLELFRKYAAKEPLGSQVLDIVADSTISGVHPDFIEAAKLEMKNRVTVKRRRLPPTNGSNEPF